MITEIVNNYSEYIHQQGWNQEYAAKAIGCSRQHMNRILNKVVVPSAALCAKMETVMGKPQNSNLDACTKAYPLGNMWIQFYDAPGTFPFTENYKEIMEVDEYPPFQDTFDLWGCNTILIIYSKSKHSFSYLEAFFYSIAGYYTKDGYIFEPYFDTQDEYCHKNEITRELNFLPNPYENCPPTIEDMHNLIRKCLINFNKQHGTDYIPCFTEQECLSVKLEEHK